MAIDPVTGTTSAATTATPAATTNSKTDALGREAFLSLLVTQLQHQNPLEPQADGEFLAQLAQFSSLESLKGIQEDMAALRSLIENEAAVPSSQGGI